jgi:hypothetical protein
VLVHVAQCDMNCCRTRQNSRNVHRMGGLSRTGLEAVIQRSSEMSAMAAKRY